MTNPYLNSGTKITEKKTSDQRDETGFDINPQPTDFVCLLLGPVGLDPPDTNLTGRPNFISTFVLRPL